MSIAYDATGQRTTPGSGDDTWTHTPAGTPAGVAVCIVLKGAAGPGSEPTISVTYGGQAMTFVGFDSHQAGPDDNIIYFYTLSAPPSGAQTVAVTFLTGGGTWDGVSVTVTSTSGGMAVDSTGHNDSGSGTTSSLTATITTVASDTVCLFGWFSGEDALGSITADTTQVGTQHDIGTECIGFGRKDGAGGAVNYAIAQSSDTAHIFGLALSEAAGTPVPSTPSGPGLKVGLGLDSAIGWEVDGRPVRMLGDWQAEVATNWGERAFTGTLNKDDLRNIEQGAPLVGWRRSGEPLWQGTIVAKPRIDGERISLRGEGNARRLAENRTRLFYRRDGGEGFVERDSEPHEYTGQSQSYDLFQGPGKLRWAWGNNADAFVNGQDAGFVLWVEGAEVTRYSVVATRNVALSNFDLLVRRFTGPTGTRTLSQTHNLTPGTSDTFANNITTPEDGIEFAVNANSSTTPAARRALNLIQIKIYGRTTDDDYSLSDVCSDVGQSSGFGTSHVTPNGTKVLPLDWTDEHPGLLDYMMELADWRWMIRGEELVVGPYGTIWETATDVGAKPSLEPEPQANTFIQPYRARSGILRYAIATASPDPFPGQEVSVWGEVLEDPQANSDLPDAVAAAAVAFESSFRMSGPVELTEVRYQGGARLPYDVEAGDQLQLTDLAPKLGPQRIEAITYRNGDKATAQVGLTFDLVRTLAENERPPRRRRRKRRHRR